METRPQIPINHGFGKKRIPNCRNRVFKKLRYKNILNMMKIMILVKNIVHSLNGVKTKG